MEQRKISLEDAAVTRDDLLAAGVPPHVVRSPTTHSTSSPTTLWRRPTRRRPLACARSTSEHAPHRPVLTLSAKRLFRLQALPSRARCPKTPDVTVR